MTEFVTTREQREHLMVAVISGGRPALKQRPTRKFLPALDGFGAEVVWVVSEKDAPAYESDGREIVVIPEDWRQEYARTHWMSPDPPNPDFLGAFPGREWACREAERRGHWGVLQLDDNIAQLVIPKDGWAGRETFERNGGFTLFADLLSAVTLSTNGWMVGGNLTSIPTVKLGVARPGLPYSMFIERVGPGREEWFGPYEDDITHAFQYGRRGGSSTALIMPLLRYHKEFTSTSGMRPFYSNTRGVSLQKIFPETVKLTIKRTRSNGKGTPRVYHHMLAGSVRNPMVVTDPDLYRAVKTRLESLLVEWHDLNQGRVREKIANRSRGGSGRDIPTSSEGDSTP